MTPPIIFKKVGHVLVEVFHWDRFIEGVCCGGGGGQTCRETGEDCEGFEADVSEGKDEAFEERIPRAP